MPLWRDRPSMSEVRIRQDRLTRRLPDRAPCLLSEIVAFRLDSTIALDVEVPESNCAARPGHRPSKNPIPTPTCSRAPDITAGRPPGRVREIPESRRRVGRPAESVPQSLPGHTPEDTSDLFPEPSPPDAAASARLRRTEDQKERAIRITPTEPVMNSLISYWMVISRMIESAPIA